MSRPLLNTTKYSDTTWRHPGRVQRKNLKIDVLLRPMTGLLATMPGILGTALLGDGRVLMILDLPELVG